MKVSVALAGFSSVPDMIETALQAEAAGATGVWVAEHLGFRDSVCTAAVLASRSQLEIGIVGPAPVSRHPATLAMELRSLAEIAPGRVRAQLGLGDPSLIRPLGGSSQKALAQVAEYTSAVRQMLSGDPVSGNFAGHETEGFTLFGAGETPAVPIEIMAMRPKMRHLAAEASDGLSLTTGAGLPYLRHCVHDARAARAAAERADQPLPITAHVLFAVNPHGPTALEKVRGALQFFSLDSLALIGQGVIDPQAIEQCRQDNAAPATLLTDEVVAGLSIAGTPDDIAQRIADFADSGIDEVALSLSAPSEAKGIAQLLTAWSNL